MVLSLARCSWYKPLGRLGLSLVTINTHPGQIPLVSGMVPYGIPEIPVAIAFKWWEQNGFFVFQMDLHSALHCLQGSMKFYLGRIGQYRVDLESDVEHGFAAG